MTKPANSEVRVMIKTIEPRDEKETAVYWISGKGMLMIFNGHQYIQCPEINEPTSWDLSRMVVAVDEGSPDGDYTLYGYHRDGKLYVLTPEEYQNLTSTQKGE